VQCVALKSCDGWDGWNGWNGMMDGWIDQLWLIVCSLFTLLYIFFRWRSKQSTMWDVGFKQSTEAL